MQGNILSFPWVVWFYVGIFTTYNLHAVELVWPKGSYGLAEPESGCPKVGEWRNGFAYHNTEDELNANSQSASNHLKGRFNDEGIEMRFCMKVEDENTNITWPNGCYCIYKSGECPEKFKEGRVFWQDEKKSKQIPNHHEGSVPDGIYNTSTTLIEFCCLGNGNASNAIDLPYSDPFYLFRALKDCQQVKNMNVKVEWVRFDDEDDGNEDYVSGTVPYGINPREDYNIILSMCYYTPEESYNLKRREIKLKQDAQLSASSKHSQTHVIVLIGSLVVVGMILVGMGYVLRKKFLIN